MEIRKILSKREDLSTFIVHLTRGYADNTAKENLESIVADKKIAAKSMYGSAKKTIEEEERVLDSQKCVCFTETPLQHLSLLTEKIEGRQCQYEKYGIAFPKKIARKKGIHPVWYVDITSGTGKDWLMKPINKMIEDELKRDNFEDSCIAKLSPFIEQMGMGESYCKEFWWEREWRHVGDFQLPDKYILICPENEIKKFKKLSNDENIRFIDPDWGLEEIIASLAGYDLDRDVRIL